MVRWAGGADRVCEGARGALELDATGCVSKSLRPALCLAAPPLFFDFEVPPPPAFFFEPAAVLPAFWDRRVAALSEGEASRESFGRVRFFGRGSGLSIMTEGLKVDLVASKKLGASRSTVDWSTMARYNRWTKSMSSTLSPERVFCHVKNSGAVMASNFEPALNITNGGSKWLWRMGKSLNGELKVICSPVSFHPASRSSGSTKAKTSRRRVKLSVNSGSPMRRYSSSLLGGKT